MIGDSLYISEKSFNVFFELPEVYSELCERLNNIIPGRSFRLFAYGGAGDDEDYIQRAILTKNALIGMLGNKARDYKFTIEKGLDEEEPETIELRVRRIK